MRSAYRSIAVLQVGAAELKLQDYEELVRVEEIWAERERERERK